MKQFFTLFTGIIMSFSSTAQVVLNELYTDPGAGKHEFFELYNTNSSSVPISLAGYSVITYFEGAGTEKGFYVLDLPDLDIPSKGYCVGSSANPFNYQSVSGSTKRWRLSFLLKHSTFSTEPTCFLLTARSITEVETT